MKKLLLLLSLATASFGATVTYLGTDEVFQGHRVGPIAATLDGMDITIFCVEFNEYVSINQTWEALIVPVLPNTTDARAAWLMEQMIDGPPGQVGTYQFAIWNLYYPNAPDTGQSDHYVTQSIGQNPAGNWYRLANNGIQDFFYQTTTETPEPSTFVLLGGALMGIGILRRVRS